MHVMFVIQAVFDLKTLLGVDMLRDILLVENQKLNDTRFPHPLCHLTLGLQ